MLLFPTNLTAQQSANRPYILNKWDYKCCWPLKTHDKLIMDFNFRRNVVSQQSFWDDFFLLLQVVKGFRIATLHCIQCTVQTLFSIVIVVGIVVFFLYQAIEDIVLWSARCRNGCTGYDFSYLSHLLHVLYFKFRRPFPISRVCVCFM